MPKTKLDQPGTFLPWVYNDQPTPQQKLRDARPGHQTTLQDLRWAMLLMQLYGPKMDPNWQVPDASPQNIGYNLWEPRSKK